MTEIGEVRTRDGAMIHARIARTKSALLDAGLPVVDDIDLIARGADEYLLIAEFRAMRIAELQARAKKSLTPVGGSAPPVPAYSSHKEA